MTSISSGLHARGVAKRYRATLALDGVDADVAPGQIAAVTGANGAGKTTLLRVFATLLRPDAGTASVNGADVVTDAEAARRSVGVALVNERSLYWRLTGLANLRFFGRLGGLSRREATERGREVAAQLGIEALLDRPASSMSAGQRQRFILARAVLGRPAALLVDEPMRGLDDDGIERVRSLLRAEAARSAAVLVAGPTIGEFADLCDHVIVLDRGRVRSAELVRP